MPKTFLPSELESDSSEEYERLYTYGQDALEAYHSTLDKKEALLLSRNIDKLNKSGMTKSQVNDGRLATIALERSARVMAQLPTGKIQALTPRNRGKAELMDLVLNKYVYPNATSPEDHLTRYRKLDLYSMVYGSMPIMYDWMVGDDYVGPNSWILPIRNVIFQPGKVTIPESDWVAVRAEVTVGWLKNRPTGENKWNKKAIKYVAEESEEAGRDPNTSDYRSFVERNRTSTAGKSWGDHALVEIVTFYEAGKDGHWVTLCPDFGWVVLRDVPNPHQSARIPVVLKHCFPLIDSMIGLGDFERGESLQMAMNSLINLYLDGVKFSIFPPVKVIQDQVASMSSIIWQPGQKWLVKNPNAIDQFNFSPGGLDTFQSTYGFMIAALLNQNGTTDTARTPDQDPGLGKTPQALQMQQLRESARDAWDRHMMEKTIEEVTNGYIDLICRKQEKPIQMGLFSEDIIRLRKLFPEDEYMEEYGSNMHDDFNLYDDKKSGMATVTKRHLSGKKGENVRYHFYIEQGTTTKREMTVENQNIEKLLMIVAKSPQAFPTINLSKLMEKYVMTSGIQDAEEVIRDEEEMQGMQMDPATGQPMPQQAPPTTQEGLPVVPGMTVPSQYGPGAPPPTPDTVATSEFPEINALMQEIQGMGGR